MSRRVYPRCPTCGSDITLAEWRPRDAWFGRSAPDPMQREFHPATCTNSACDWEGPKDEAAVREAQARSTRQAE
jgi:NAD-dependent SIR2 family protein deacetylase